MARTTRPLEVRQRFAITLLAERKTAALTQLELSELIGVDEKTVQRWEQAATFPLPVNLRDLAKALGVSVFHLLEGASGAAASSND